MAAQGVIDAAQDEGAQWAVLAHQQHRITARRGVARTSYCYVSMACCPHSQDRRAVLGMIAASAPLLASSPAFAAYGDSANVAARQVEPQP